MTRSAQTSPWIRPAFTKMEVAVVLAICGGLIALLYPAVQMARNPKGPHGEIYPTVPPAEERRITHATGLSIIAPVNWDQIRDDHEPEVPFLSVSCRGRPGARLRSWITICDSEPPDENNLAGFRKTQFGESPAYETMNIERTNNGYLSVYQLYVDHRGQWWSVTFHVAEQTTTLSPAIKQYIDTIRFPAGPATK